METFKKLCGLYDHVMAGSSLTTQNVKELLDSLKQMDSMEPVNQCTDTILLIFSIFHLTTLKNKWPEGAFDALNNTINFSLLVGVASMFSCMV